MQCSQACSCQCNSQTMSLRTLCSIGMEFMPSNSFAKQPIRQHCCQASFDPPIVSPGRSTCEQTGSSKLVVCNCTKQQAVTHATCSRWFIRDAHMLLQQTNDLAMSSKSWLAAFVHSAEDVSTMTLAHTDGMETFHIGFLHFAADANIRWWNDQATVENI